MQAGPNDLWVFIRPVWVFVLVLLCIFLIAVFAPFVTSHDPNYQNLLARLKPPGYSTGSRFYLLGTDELGRDLLTRIVYGARISLLVAFLSVSISLTFGVLIGMVAGYFRGFLEVLIMRMADIFLSIPAILLAILTVAVLGPSLLNLVLVLAFTRWPRYTRVAYAQTLSVAGSLYIKSSAYSGTSNTRILMRHILPNILAPLIVLATLEFGLMILFEGGLSFLGLGVQPPMPSWGSILSVGRNYISSAWWIVTLPGICLFVVVLSINVLGDFLRDKFDPRSLGR
ncbi:MAG: ABC transporter permease [Paracoccaceae bacterium]|jgi:peptide/nickel transport system permease protein|nr:ABC transporter permease [Paracoccaceae bacterium]MDG1259311.1 ABC transporter permease [Paracoccaceae bacterium]MDG1317760.1 ABC transporter permease [Paracoccaceae bacterium]